MRVPLQQQIDDHRKSISELSKRADLMDVCGMRKSAAHWRAAIAACESCIRACERRIAGGAK